MSRRIDDVARQYSNSDPLQVRIDTYRLYQARTLDLDEEARNLLDLAGHERILDAGCGPGRFLSYLRNMGHTGYLAGLDQSPGMIAELMQTSPSIVGIAGDVSQLPFADQAFDAAIARHMLYHVEDISAALDELRRVARRKILISTGSRDATLYLDGLLAQVVSDFGYTPSTRIMSRFCIENAGDWLSGAGFTWREVLFENALVFRSGEPIINYVLSCLPSFGIVPGSARYVETITKLSEIVDNDLATSNGVIRDPTSVGFFVVEEL